MPGFNRTGPRGTGPMTGGGRGLCNHAGTRRAHHQCGRGRRMRCDFRGYGYYGIRPVASGMDDFNPSMNEEQEVDFLKEKAKELKNRLGQMESRIEQLGS